MAKGGGGQVQRVEPPRYLQPQLQQQVGAAGEAFAGGELGRVAGFTPEQQAAQQLLTQFAQGHGQQFTGDIGQTFLDFMRSASDVEANPALQGYIQAAIRPLTQNLTEQILPSIRGGAQGAGQVGSSRQGIAEGLASGRTQQASGDITANIINAAFQQGRQDLARGFALAPGVLGLQTAPAQLLEQVGLTRQAQAQAELDQPFNAIRQYQQLLSGNFGQTTSVTGGEPSTGASLLGGAAAGASIGSAFGPPGTAMGAGWGAAIGAALSLL